MIPENDMPEVLVRDIGIGFDAGEEGDALVRFSGKKKIWTGFLPARRWEIREPSERCWYFAGSGAMCGAAVLCARAVLASGAVMVKVVTEERNRTPLFLCPAGSNGGFLEGG